MHEFPQRQFRFRIRTSFWNRIGLCLVPAFLLAPWPASAQTSDSELKAALTEILQVGKNGAGHAEAVSAMAVLNRATPSQVPVLLAAMENANSVAQNWIRGAIQSALADSAEMPVAELRTFLDTPSSNDMGRLMAWELLTAAQPGLADELLPTMLDDPGLALRQLAVDWHLRKASEAEGPENLLLLSQALPAARNVNQVQQIAARLDERGIRIDLQRQLGFINTWKIAGPFDNRKQEGFARAMGPELDLNAVDPTATYKDGLDGAEVQWVEHKTVEPTGVVNINEILGKVKGAAAYAYAEFEATEDADCQIRIGCINANKVWLNGQEVLANEVYHVGMMPDQFAGDGKLVKGTNRILIKVCQNEQEQPWAQEWMFQLRVCGRDGSAISPAKPPAPEM